MLTLLVLAILLFTLAGYYGSVRVLLLESTVDWHRLRHEDEGHFFKVIYWRRMLRMARLLAVGLACFCLVAAGYTGLLQLGGSDGLALLVLLLGAVMLWLIAYAVWMKAGRTYPALMRLESYAIRFAEWLLTPVYWFLEPLVKEKPGESRAAAVRDETASADDPDFEDHSMEERMFINALDFKDVRLRDCMIPRTEISAVSLEDTIEDLRQAFITSGHSKILVYRDSVDEVVGYCHSLALFRKPKEISSIITPILIVPEAMPASDLMLRFLEERKSLALVVDEFGGTSGLVSVEDVVEEIFGEIQDEYDTTEDWTERQIDESTFIFSARHEIDYLNEKYDWSLPEGDYDTLAGLLIHIHEDLPKVNDVISQPPFTFKVVSMQDTRIELVRLTIEAED
jgi:CBS domain containing-hemolysin-like protein